MSDEIRNAVVASAEIRIERGILLDCWLFLDYGGSGQGFGGWALYLDKNCSHHDMKSVAGHHIYRCLEVCGVESWSKVAGRTVRARIRDGRIVAIGHIIKDDWYEPGRDFTAAKEATDGN